MAKSLSIRVATEQDAAALQDLYLHLSEDNSRCSEAVAQGIITKLGLYEGSAILIGDVDGNMVSSCTVVVIPNLTRGGMPYAVIENVVTHGDHRGKGYGKAMLDAASDRAWLYGCYKVMLSTGSKKPSTLAFYEDAGFEQSKTGFQKRRFPKRVES
jgi:GNAT superfamily N-acetyltransferase